jgi:DNA-binding XRE family transcriptional regulator
MAKVIDSPLTREMTRRGLRRNWMAERLGVRPWTFSRIEGGTQAPPADWYPRAAEILGVDVAVITPEDAEVAA